MDMLPKRTLIVLKDARYKYGAKNQILVAIEELNELSCVLAKYPRYDTHKTAVSELRGRVLEELGDVFNVIEHVQSIFGIADDEIVQAAAKKGDRLCRWLTKDGMEVTTLDREVPETPCGNCKYKGILYYEMPCYACNKDNGYSGFVARD